MNLKSLSAGTFLALSLFQCSAANLVHRYPFTANASDVVGGANGVLSGGATIAGGAVVLNGSSAFVDLPNNLVSNLTSITYEAWFTDNGGNGWARLWDFGNSSSGEGNQGTGTSYMFLSVPSGFGGVRGALHDWTTRYGSNRGSLRRRSLFGRDTYGWKDLRSVSSRRRRW